MSEQGQSLREQLELFLNEQLEQIVISNPRDAEIARKIKVRPVGLRGQLAFQAEEFRGKQAFHRNLPKAEMIAFIDEAMSSYRQLELTSESGRLTVLVSKNGKRTVKMRRLQAAGAEAQSKEQAQPGEQQTQLDRQQVQLGGQQAGPDRQQAQPAGQKIRPAGQQAVPDRQRTQPAGQKMRPAGQQVQPPLQHNRRKRYILEEGRPVPFLKDLGVMTAEGKIVSARYDKFRQINRFLEFIEDILPKLPREREVRIIDFGCGKSYLTFAMYYYLHELCGCDVRITGLDLKQDVIDHCSALAVRYGYEKLEFLHGDIADFEGEDQVDMVVTLHACDTATDYALAKAVRWNASVILSVPCCQHELNGQIGNELMKPVFQYGIVKERMAALYTDALRAEILENQGYRTQILEFIDMEHTPKNLLLRCVRDGRKKDNRDAIEAIVHFLGAEPTLMKLLM